MFESSRDRLAALGSRADQLRAPDDELAVSRERIAGYVARTDAMAAEIRRLREALAKADAEVAVLADALRAAGVKYQVQDIIDSARHEGGSR